MAKRDRTGEPSTGPGFVGSLSYDLFRLIEPKAEATAGATNDRHWPVFALAWCPSVHVFDVVRNRWDWSAELSDSRSIAAAMQHRSGNALGRNEILLGALQTSATSAEHHDRVKRTMEFIAAGDIFQASIALRLTLPFRGDVRQLATAAFGESRAWYGAYLEIPWGGAKSATVISMSPELFLRVDGRTREVITRPIKGTRSALSRIADLARSAKDAAELHMIVDLMRNDLGRVCEFGSIRVRSPREIESHPTVLHGVAEITGRLRRSITVGDLLRATFPPGSVTGVPKIRAMQVIDEVEPVRRGPYCGAIGWFGLNGDVTLSVAIRSMALSGTSGPGRFDMIDGMLDYGTGGGIVADSQPADEYRETMDKAAILFQTLKSLRARTSRGAVG